MRDTRAVVALSDTSPEVSQVYFLRLGAMTPAERSRLGTRFGRRRSLFNALWPAVGIRTQTRPKWLFKWQSPVLEQNWRERPIEERHEFARRSVSQTMSTFWRRCEERAAEPSASDQVSRIRITAKQKNLLLLFNYFQHKFDFPNSPRPYPDLETVGLYRRGRQPDFISRNPSKKI